MRRTSQASRKNKRQIYFEGEGRHLFTDFVEAELSKEGLDKSLPELRLQRNALTKRLKLSFAYEGRHIKESPCLREVV
jgi:hypothetical protein